MSSIMDKLRRLQRAASEYVHDETVHPQPSDNYQKKVVKKIQKTRRINLKLSNRTLIYAGVSFLFIFAFVLTLTFMLVQRRDLGYGDSKLSRVAKLEKEKSVVTESTIKSTSVRGAIATEDSGTEIKQTEQNEQVETKSEDIVVPEVEKEITEMKKVEKTVAPISASEKTTAETKMTAKTAISSRETAKVSLLPTEKVQKEEIVEQITPEENLAKKKILQELKLNGVYKAERGYIALINGSEIQEGDIFEQMVVKEITLQYIVFKYKNKRYRCLIKD